MTCLLDAFSLFRGVAPQQGKPRPSLTRLLLRNDAAHNYTEHRPLPPEISFFVEVNVFLIKQLFFVCCRGMRRRGVSSSLVVFGANTDVGKTVCSIGVVQACLRRGSVAYLKPVQTGSVHDSASVLRYATIPCCESLYNWERAVSPHVAAAGTPVPTKDELASRIKEWVAEKEDGKYDFLTIETAGGALSPAPDASFQADVYASAGFRSCILVGDPKLGGISTTMCAKESLEARGMRISTVVFIGGDEENLGNADFVRRYCDVTEISEDLPPAAEPLDRWLESNASSFDDLVTRVSCLVDK